MTNNIKSGHATDSKNIDTFLEIYTISEITFYIWKYNLGKAKYLFLFDNVFHAT